AVVSGFAVFGGAFCGADVWFRDSRVAGLILFVARSGMIDVGEAIESQFAIALETFGRRAAVDLFVGFVAGVRAHGINQAAATGDLLERGVNESGKHPVREGLVKIANVPELFFDVTLLDLFR